MVAPGRGVAGNGTAQPGRVGRTTPVLIVLLFAIAFMHSVQADELSIEVNGVSERMANNVRAQLGGGWVSGGVLSSERRRERFVERARVESVIALRPYGHYAAKAEARLERDSEDSWRLQIDLQPGQPVRIASVELRIEGAGAAHPPVAAWQDGWPLRVGEVLDQTVWEAQKLELDDVLEEEGFFLPEVHKRRIALDLDADRAHLEFVLDTGPRAVLGDVRFEQDFVDERVLTPVPRFESGDAYRGWLVEQFRADLWKLGFFRNIAVTEARQLDSNPPTVDLLVQLEESHRVTHQGTVGYGTDTEFRMQYRWQRHLLSDRGDSMALGFGGQTRNQEMQLFGEYRLPRKVEAHEYWLFNPIFKRKDQVFELDIEGRETKLAIAEGRIDDTFARFGRVRLRNPTFSREQIIETVFAQLLSERNRGTQIINDIEVDDGLVDELVPQERINSLAFGMEWDWPVITGRGFDLTGHRERATVFISDEVWGSDVDYAQAYVSSRWTFRFADNWRVLLRGELGYSDAEVDEFSFEEDGLTFGISVTELPFQYRFKAGGSFSVRGYGYESLSNNGIGSNHLITASVEVERRVWGDWSVAAFADAGNAFNDWSNSRLRKGVGMGVRWYTIGFPLRLDVASALDLEGEPWRVHFTIGSTLF